MDTSAAVLEGQRNTEYLTFNNEALYTYIFDASKQKYRDVSMEVPQNPPEFLTHVAQVSLVAEEIVRASNLEESQKQKAMTDARRYGLVHDIGRVDDIGTFDTPKYNGNAHPKNGVTRLQTLGFGTKYVEFAINHHQWGLGIEGEGIETVGKVAREQGIESAVAAFESRYGLAGLACVVADVSKAYTNPYNKQLPEITALTPEGAHGLLNRQLQNGNFERGGERHKTEELGITFALGVINHLQENYGIDYKFAIGNALKRWEISSTTNISERQKVQKTWNQEYPFIFPSLIPTQPVQTLA